MNCEEAPQTGACPGAEGWPRAVLAGEVLPELCHLCSPSDKNKPDLSCSAGWHLTVRLFATHRGCGLFRGLPSSPLCSLSPQQCPEPSPAPLSSLAQPNEEGTKLNPIPNLPTMLSVSSGTFWSSGNGGRASPTQVGFRVAKERWCEDYFSATSSSCSCFPSSLTLASPWQKLVLPGQNP